MTEVRVGLGRSNVVVTICLLLFVGGIAGVAAYSGLRAEGSARFLALGIAVIFAIPLLMLLKALPTFFAQRHVVLDGHGLRIQHGKDEVLLPWPQVAAVGVGYQQIAGEPEKVPLTLDAVQEAAVGRLREHAQEALHVSERRKLTLEIFPVAADAGAVVAKLRPYWRQTPPPMPGLPPFRWSFPLPPVTGIGERIADGVRTVQPNRWLGWIVRS